jgi:hypothetical protein
MNQVQKSGSVSRSRYLHIILQGFQSRNTVFQMARSLSRNFHFLATAILILGLVPAFHFAHLPLRFTWKSYLGIYWWSLGFQSMIAAIVLYAIGFPSEFREKLLSRVERREGPREAVLAIFIPAAYFFLMFFLVFSYNDAIAVLRFDGLADVVLNRMDSWILGGATLSSLAHSIPLRLSKLMEVVYFLMFSLIGGCLILLALRCGRETAMRFIATIATAYYIGLIVFYFVPATGPYYLSAMNHDGNYIGLGQRAFVQMLNSMKDHQPPQVIGTDYFIGLPCLHVTQPLISIWFVRKWKPIAITLFLYCLVLIPSILLLEQHYVVDVIAGAALAVLAIAMVSNAEVPRVQRATLRGSKFSLSVGG